MAGRRGGGNGGGFAPRGWRHGAPPPLPGYQAAYHRPPAAPPLPPGSSRPSAAEIAAFIEGFRASNSRPSAAPSALSASSVAHAACTHFGFPSFEELSGGVPALQFPALRQLQLVTQRVWTFVACFVSSRRVNTLFECLQALLQHEGVRDFCELRMGNSFLLCEPVQAMYHAPSAMPAVTTRDVLAHLQQFQSLVKGDAFMSQQGKSSRIDLSEFLQYLSQQYRQPRPEAMGVLIDPTAFGVYIGMLRRIANHEMKELKALESEFHKGIAEKVFELTKEKFSTENRKQALDDLLSAQERRHQGELSSTDAATRRSGPSASVLASISSLSLDLLNRVTEVDVYLDNVLRRKSAAFERARREQPNQKQYRGRPISSQAIAETDLKIRNQMTRFLVSSPQSKHHSRLKVVTWVLCGIMAKIHALLLSDDRLPEDEEDSEKKGESKSKAGASKRDDASDEGEECDCCCVGKDACRCSCQCECHVDSDDEEKEEFESKETKKKESPSMNAEEKVPTATKLETKSTTSKSELLHELHQLIDANAAFDTVQNGKQLLEALSAVESQVLEKFSGRLPVNDTADNSLPSNSSLLQIIRNLAFNEDHSTIELAEAFDEAPHWLKLLDDLQISDVRSHSIDSDKQGKSTVSLEIVLDFVAQCQRTIESSPQLSAAPLDRRLQWIERYACIEFSCTSFDELDIGTLDQVMKMLAVQADATGLSKSTHPTAIVKFSNALLLPQQIGEALAVPSGASETQQEGESASIQLLTRQAAEHVIACPCVIVDVGQFTNWNERYAPELGALLPFIRAHEMILLDHAARSSHVSSRQSLMFVSCRNGEIVRINENATASDLELHAQDASANATSISTGFVATTLVSLYVTSGSSDFPLQLVQVHLRALIALAKDKQAHEPTKNQLCNDPASRFVVDVLASTPADFREVICSVLEPALSSPSQGLGERLWLACSGDAEHAMLALLDRRGALRLAETQREQWTGHSKPPSTGADNPNEKIIATAEANAGAMDGVAMEDALSSKSDSAAAYFNAASSTDPVTRALNDSGEELHTSSISSDLESCKAFIEVLRREQFGVGLDIQDEAARSVLAIQRKRLERALKRLSDELYSENTHFVLELLQNADDNTYDLDVVPRSEFTLTHNGEIVFYNNEVGFSQANIRAICDVGASTKENDSSSRSIGKKGIGFKSVFKVSDTPEVHSNGFHIRFRARDTEYGGGMGYILPHWITVEEGASSSSRWARPGTTFVLPLNSGSTERAAAISESLLAVEPSILLFLHRIRALRIRDEVRNVSTHFLKMETPSSTCDHQIVELFARSMDSERVPSASDALSDSQNGISRQRWFVAKDQLSVAQAFIEAGRPHETELAVAIPFDPSTQGTSAEPVRPALQQVFAYLPLRSYGFRFIIQGDFEVPSSREAIINGSEWNQWLISKLPSLVVKAVEAFAKEATEAGVDAKVWVTHLMSLLPLDTEVQAPFRSAVADTMRALRYARWLPCLSSDASKVTLFRPVDVLDCSDVWGQTDEEDGIDPVVKSNALSEELLESIFNKRQLDPQVAASMSASLRLQLRIEQLHASHVMRLLGLSPSKNDPRWTAAIVALFARVAKRERHSKLLLQELRLIPFFPLQGAESKWLSLADANDAIYFPPSYSKSEELKTNTQTQPGVNAFVSELHILSDEFSVAAKGFQEAHTFLTRNIGIKIVDEHEVISRYILPEMAAASKPMTSGVRALVSPTRMIEFAAVLATHVSDCGGVNCALAEDIRAKCCVLTSFNRFVGADFTDEDDILAVLAPSVVRALPVVEPWLLRRIEQAVDNECEEPNLGLVSPRYFAVPNIPEAAWKTLFVDVCRMPEIFGRGSTATAASVLALDPVLRWLEDESDVRLRAMVSAQLADYIDNQWLADTVVRELLENPNSGDSSDDDSTSPAAITRMWQSRCWMISSRGEWKLASGMWLKSAETETLFPSGSVHLCQHSWRHRKFATDMLGLKVSAEVDDVLSVLSSLSAATSKVTASSISSMYAFLWEQSKRVQPDVHNSIASRFTEGKLICAVADGQGDDEPTWIRSEEAVWSSTDYNAPLATLEDLYPASLRDFFVQICGVLKKPSTVFLSQSLVKYSNDVFNNLKPSDNDKKGKKKQRRQWTKRILPVLEELATRIRKSTLAKDDLRAVKKALKASSWLPVVVLDRPSYSPCYSSAGNPSSHLRPVRLVSDADRKLHKSISSILKVSKDSGSTGGLGIAIVELEGDKASSLEPLLSLTRLSSVSDSLTNHPKEWCNALVRLSHNVASSGDMQGKFTKTLAKKFAKLLRLVISKWASNFASAEEHWQASRGDFRLAIQSAPLFPSSGNASTFVEPIQLYLNDQVDLEESALLSSTTSAPSLSLLELYSFDYFVDCDQKDESGIDSITIRHFLLEWCGLKSLKASMAHEVITLGPQRPASTEIVNAVLEGIALAQRVLYHHHCSIYDRLPHLDLQTNVNKLKCVVVEGPDALQAVYRVDGVFSQRQSSIAAFYDAEQSIMFLSETPAGDDDMRALFPVLMELTRKFLGLPPSTASSVANMLYLSSLQPVGFDRERWLLATQHLPLLPSDQNKQLWVISQNDRESPPSTQPALTNHTVSRKRAIEDLKDGEVECEESFQQPKKTRTNEPNAPPAGPWTIPFPTSNNNNGSYEQDEWTNRYPTAQADPSLPLPPLPMQTTVVPPPSIASATPLGNTLSVEERSAIGRWGEEYVYKQLAATHRDSSELSVTWVNEKEESGLPYDITLSSATSGTVVEYVEVKSTRTMEKGVFEISMNELDQAAMHGSTYSIYRVFNAGDAARCRVIRMKNPVSLVRQKKIQLALVMQ